MHLHFFWDTSKTNILVPFVIHSTTAAGHQPVTTPRSAAGTAAARGKQQGEPRGEVIKSGMATEKYMGSGLSDTYVTSQELTVNKKNPKHFP